MEGEEIDGVAVSRNISTTGVLMVSAAALEVGATVKVVFQLPGDDEERVLESQIIRVEENDEDPAGLWPHRVALQFDKSVTELEPLLEEVAKRELYSAPPPPPDPEWT
jgi:hypothetical protein